MYRHPHDLERSLVRISSPSRRRHCSSCMCRELRPPVHSPPQYRIIRKWESYSDLDLPEIREIRNCGRSCSCCILQSARRERTSSTVKHRVAERAPVSDKFSLMERWFQRYDSDDDGFLDPTDLQSLFRNLGKTISLSKCERILDEADTKGKRLLSFKGFLQLWHKAAYHEHELVSATDCVELVDIAREYDLYPDVPCSHCDGRKPRWVSNIERRTEDTINCNCGYEKNINPFVKLFDEEKKEKIDREVSGKRDDSYIPIMSSNCNTFG